MTSCARSLAFATISALLLAATATASPTMVRLGYARCGTCHFAPQGAGLLTDYGKGIDQAQSLKGGDYQVPENTQPAWLRYDGRLLTSIYGRAASDSGAMPAAPTWLRGFFRNSAFAGPHNRFASTLIVESPQGDPDRLFHDAPEVDATAVWEFRMSDVVTLAFTRDRLPRGVELGETRTILQDGLDPDRFPTQIKAFIGNDRVFITPYAYAPGSSSAFDRSASGAGALAEVQFFSNHVVIGGSVRRSNSDAVDRNTVGAFTRFGFGKWGMLAEHEYTQRTLAIGADPSPHRYAGYTQLFVAPWEWLVTSLIGEQSYEPGAVRERVFRWRPEVQARLSPNVTITASERNDTFRPDDGTARMYLVQVALKTVR